MYERTPAVSTAEAKGDSPVTMVRKQSFPFQEGPANC